MKHTTVKPIIILVCLLLGLGKLILAQDVKDTVNSRPRNNISVNLYGNGSILSLNYDRIDMLNSNAFLSYLIGGGYTEEFAIFSSVYEKYYTIPHHVTYNWGRRSNFIEGGFGGTVIIGETSQPYFFYPTLGYRWQHVRRDVHIRLYGSWPVFPVWGMEGEDILFIPVGFSFGFSF